MDYITQNINVLIFKSGFKISELAKEMGVTKQTVYNIKKGQITIDNLIKLSEILKVPISEFFKKQENLADSEANEDIGTYGVNSNTINILSNQIQIKDKQISELISHIKWMERNFEQMNDKKQLQKNI